MKSILHFAAASLFATTASLATDYWGGTLELPNGATLPIEIEIMTNAAGETDANMASPAQGMRYVPVSDFETDEDSISISTVGPVATIEGPVNDDEWHATFKQGNFEAPIVFRPIPGISEVRPLSPIAGASESDLNFKSSSADAMLSGTLTVPTEGPVRAAVLILPGSGPSQRDGYHNGHRPLAVLAHQLATAGIASLRYDKRGVYKSTGTLDPSDIDAARSDAEAALAALRSATDLPIARIGIAGHSEGGLIAMQLRAEKSKIGFAISLMGPTMPVGELFALQDYTETLAAGASQEEARKFADFTTQLYATAGAADTGAERMAKMMESLQAADESDAELFQRFNGGSGTLSSAMLQSDQYDELLNIQPADYLTASTVPTLLLFGEKDMQVPAKNNLAAIPADAAITTVVLDDLNHVMQTADTGATSEYAQIDETLAPAVSKTIIGWLDEKVSLSAN